MNPPTPSVEKCPTCQSDDPALVAGLRYRIDADCPDPWHDILDTIADGRLPAPKCPNCHHSQAMHDFHDYVEPAAPSCSCVDPWHDGSPSEVDEYEPFDQEKWLVHGPPFLGNDPAVIAWEAAHGHDFRLKCYVEFGCLVIEPTLERQVAALLKERASLKEALQDLFNASEEMRLNYTDPAGVGASMTRAAVALGIPAPPTPRTPENP